MNTTPEQQEAARARMAELAAKFVERTRNEVNTLRSKLAQLGDGDAATLADIFHIAHRMCGTGGTLGLEAISSHAHRIQLLARAQPPGAVPDAAALQQLSVAVDELAAVLARHDARG